MVAIEDRTIIGIDPGITGAAVALHLSGTVISRWSFSDDHEFRRIPGYNHLTRNQIKLLRASFHHWIYSMDNVILPKGIFFIEQPLKNPGKILSVNWGYLQYLLGVLQGICGIESDVILLGQHLWKRRFFPTAKKEFGKEFNDKELAYLVAQARFGEDIPLTKRDHGLNDAALIAEFGRLLYKEKNGKLDTIEAACAL